MARQTLETANAITARMRFSCTIATSAMTTVAMPVTRTRIKSGPGIRYHDSLARERP